MDEKNNALINIIRKNTIFSKTNHLPKQYSVEDNEEDTADDDLGGDLESFEKFESAFEEQVEETSEVKDIEEITGGIQDATTGIAKDNHIDTQDWIDITRGIKKEHLLYAGALATGAVVGKVVYDALTAEELINSTKMYLAINYIIIALIVNFGVFGKFA